MQWDVLDVKWDALRAKAPAHWGNYLGFYSSWLDGYFKEPWAMTVPMDDHGFHRGDGVFEAVRVHRSAYIDLRAHLRRLENSAKAIQMDLPKSIDEIESICKRLAHLCQADTGVLRLYVTRGPGSFSPAPSEVIGHQIYAALTRLREPAAESYRSGVRALFSTIPAKEARWSQIKSCNYLQNVLMKKECVDRGYDIAVSLDEQGRVCEGATENLMIVSAAGELLVPRFDYTLRGTTVSVVMGLAESLVREGLLRAVRLADLTKPDLIQAREAAFVGTTLGVLPVRSFDHHELPGIGPVAPRLHQLWVQAMETSAELRTPFL